ncbi:MAG: cellulase family glycosylhydrolase, partial [Spirochaetales bacterium]|nr:cellulase family glycosylhydrolase [Spirochaetales bacterium]
PDGSSYRPESLADPQGVSFVGRPFPLEEADDHYARIAGWGFRFLRFLISWEAVEHEGPGIYDLDYLDYLEAVVAKAADHDLGVWIDPHQDVWSRWTGGDGAPAWTLELAGMDLEKIAPTGSAVVHALFRGEGLLRDQIHRLARAREKSIPLKESFTGSRDRDAPLPPKTFPSMIWPTNYTRYACATMFSLFFGGRTYAPSFLVEGRNIQDYLQHRYFSMIRTVAARLAAFPHVIGFGSMNEPHRGYIGWEDLDKPSKWLMRNGPNPTGLQGMAAASGFRQIVRNYRFTAFGPVATGYASINDGGHTLWKDGFECPWRREGVWDVVHGKPVLLRPRYFGSSDPRKSSGSVPGGSSFAEQFLKPFLTRCHEIVNEIDRRFLVFIEGVPAEPHPSWHPRQDGEQAVNGSHWYDAFTLITKRYAPRIAFDSVNRRPVFGKRCIQRSFERQIGHELQVAAGRMGGIPSVVGEFGIPFDLKGNDAFYSGDYREHAEALDSCYRAMDANLIGSFLWNYSPDNTHLLGDRWNDEDLSIFSSDSGGGRAVNGFLRPYALATAGTPVSMRYRRRKRVFDFQAEPDGDGSAGAGPTLVFVPRALYPEGFAVELQGGQWSYDQRSQILSIRAEAPPAGLKLRLEPKGN